MAEPNLLDLGQRIVILGPSNAGKSTLALAIGAKLGIPAVHLDQLYHLPNSNWVPRPPEAFAALHDKAITGESWVMDGNYSKLFPQRFARATGAIVLGSNRWSNFGRYLKRTLLQKQRAGALEGGKDSIKWQMVRWILVVAPKNIVGYREKVAASGLPLVRIDSMRELKRLYRLWGLSVP